MFNNVTMVIKFIGIEQEINDGKEIWTVFNAVYEFDNREQFDLSVYVDNPGVLSKIKPKLHDSSSEFRMLVTGELDYIEKKIVLKASNVDLIKDFTAASVEYISREFVDFSND